jgi:uncharacterized protein
VHSSFAAYYYPWVTVIGFDGVTHVTIPPGGHLAGVYVRTDAERGVWKAPAGVQLLGALGLSQALTASESDLMNSRAINVLRSFPTQGILVWGARTTDLDTEWQYVNIRRFLIFIEQSLDQGLQWVVFEPNGFALWEGVRVSIESFLIGLWKSAALMGQTVRDAFFVRCDQTTTSQSDIDCGRVVVIVGVAVVRPAEFIILRITCQSQAASR